MFILNRMTVYLNPLKGFSVGQAASNTERASPLPFLDLMTILKNTPVYNSKEVMDLHSFKWISVLLSVRL